MPFVNIRITKEGHVGKKEKNQLIQGVTKLLVDTLGKNPEGRKVKGVVHWVPAAASIECEVRLYDRLFRSPNPEKAEDSASFLDNINPDSLQVLTGCRAEPSLGDAQPEDRFQFEREGYFCADIKDSKPGHPVFNRTVTLRDSWGQ